MSDTITVSHTPLPRGSSDEYAGERFRDRFHEWDCDDDELQKKLAGKKITVKIDGQVVKRVRWCNVRTGLAQVVVSGDDDQPLMFPGLRDVATVFVQGMIEITVEDVPDQMPKCQLCGEPFSNLVRGHCIVEIDGKQETCCGVCAIKKKLKVFATAR